VGELKSASPENGATIKRKINDLLRHAKGLSEEVAPVVQAAKAAITDWLEVKNQAPPSTSSKTIKNEVTSRESENRSHTFPIGRLIKGSRPYVLHTR
jgi:hypothetical protein